MRQLGAIWRESKYDIRKRPSEFSEPHEILRGSRCIHIGWPSSGEGFWLLAISKFEVRGMPVSLIYNAITTDEKCEMIKLLGGIFITDPKKYPFLDLAE